MGAHGYFSCSHSRWQASVGKQVIPPQIRMPGFYHAFMDSNKTMDYLQDAVRCKKIYLSHEPTLVSSMLPFQ
ncbi:unnamed protein product [Urochloa humidicola]